jgi:hypothetical protein
MPRLDFDHETGAHCGSTSLRDLSTYYGWGFDEPTCFGLGEGLGFSYLELPESPHRAIFGRTGWLERAFFENCGIDHEIHEGEQFAEAWSTIKTRIDGGDPVLIFADLFYLDYYETDTHFAPHSLVVVGYDERNSEEYVHLADSEFAEIQRLPTERLQNALTSEHVVPLQCRYLTVDDPTVTVGFAEAAEAAIRETVTYMLDPAASARESKYFSSQGVSEIEAFAEDLPTWDDLPDPSWTARFASQNIERRGTGGGAFRRLFASFLEIAGESISVPDDVAAEMETVADDWTELAAVLREVSESDSPADCQSLLREASQQASAIAAREQELYRAIRKALD